MHSPVLWLLVGYLCGSLPTAYLAGKLFAGIDIRDYGSGNVGGSNVLRHVSRSAFVLVAAVDIGKAVLSVWLALSLGGSPTTAASAGVGAVAGHCWSVFLSFTGGRGMASALGSLLPVFPIGGAWIVAVHLLGGALGLAAPADLLAVATLPVVANFVTGSQPLVWQCLGLLLIVVTKRLHANRLPLPDEPGERRAVLWRRLIYDRDVPRDQPWAERVPTSRESRPSS